MGAKIQATITHIGTLQIALLHLSLRHMSLTPPPPRLPRKEEKEEEEKEEAVNVMEPAKGEGGETESIGTMQIDLQENEAPSCI